MWQCRKKKNSCWVYFQVCLTQYYFLFLPNEELCFHIYKKFSLTIKFRAQVKNIVFSQEEIVIEENEVSRRSVVEKKKGIMWQWFCHLALSLAPWYRLQFVRLSRARCIQMAHLLNVTKQFQLCPEKISIHYLHKVVIFWDQKIWSLLLPSTITTTIKSNSICEYRPGQNTTIAY